MLSSTALDTTRLSGARALHPRGVAATSRPGSYEQLLSFLVTRRTQLLRACLRWTRGHCADAEDLLSDACLRIIESGHGSAFEVSEPTPFCMTVIANLARDRWRAEQRRDTTGPLQVQGDSTQAHGPDEIAASRELLVMMLARSQRLPSAQRRALVLRSFGRDYAEIARSLCTSPGNARKLVQLARMDMLRELPASQARKRVAD